MPVSEHLKVNLAIVLCLCTNIVIIGQNFSLTSYDQKNAKLIFQLASSVKSKRNSYDHIFFFFFLLLRPAESAD